MKNNQKHIYIPINMLLFSAVLFVFTACQNSQNKTGLELTLLNNSLQVYCPNGDCSDYSALKKNPKRGANRIVFTIKNPTDRTYVFSPISVSGSSAGSGLFNIFGGMDLFNFKFEDQKGNFAKLSSGLSEIDACDIRRDSLITTYYKKLGYTTPSILVLKNYVEHNTVIIPSHETIYYENVVGIPYNTTPLSPQSVELKKNKTYTVSLEFKADTTNLKKFFSKSLLKTIKENHYRIFTGELKSNSIPLVFKQ